MHFWKYQALGNDYIVMDGRVQTAPSADLVRRICDRHFGVGSDGILWHEEAGGGIALRIYNPDGSEAEKSGNGLRIFARYLFDRGLVAGDPFAVTTPGGRVSCHVLDGGARVQVEMGRVSRAAKSRWSARNAKSWKRRSRSAARRSCSPPRRSAIRTA
jgi:diaminopimelate epimerase